MKKKVMLIDIKHIVTLGNDGNRRVSRRRWTHQLFVDWCKRQQ